MVQHVKGDLDSAELHLDVVMRPGVRDVVRFHPDRDQERGTQEHAGQNALATFKPETFRQGHLFRGAVKAIAIR
jgi:hypothetical protein